MNNSPSQLTSYSKPHTTTSSLPKKQQVYCTTCGGIHEISTTTEWGSMLYICPLFNEEEE